jgi:hypothetical protein
LGVTLTGRLFSFDLRNPEREEPSKLEKKVVIYKVCVKCPLALDGKLPVKLLTIPFVREEVVLVLRPLKQKKGSDLVLYLSVDPFAVVIEPQKSEELVKLVFLGNLQVQALPSEDHAYQLSHHVTECGDTE